MSTSERFPFKYNLLEVSISTNHTSTFLFSLIIKVYKRMSLFSQLPLLTPLELCLQQHPFSRSPRINTSGFGVDKANGYFSFLFSSEILISLPSLF